MRVDGDITLSGPIRPEGFGTDQAAGQKSSPEAGILPARDRQRGAVDKAGGLGSQEDAGEGNLVDLAEAAQRDMAGRPWIEPKRSRHFRNDLSPGGTVDPANPAAPLPCLGPAQVNHPPLPR